MRVVIDTNVFISSLLSSAGNPRKVIDLWRLEKFTLCLSKDILTEYFAVLGRMGMADEPEGAELVQLFEARYNQAFVASPPPISVIAEDPDDDKFISCAVAAGARYIVSGDRHLQNLKTFRGVRILPPTEFVKLKAFAQRRRGTT
ncbi:MAG TPA: putative toxin-antitoxin system toxin component, PIN family [Thermodesulfobacteriota bacterium]|nr:putative toxin-antitoxin system toxin component, PIN family [Thermodesulfobacteriota bacterium]